jgi:hypothetical protein
VPRWANRFGHGRRKYRDEEDRSSRSYAQIGEHHCRAVLHVAEGSVRVRSHGISTDGHRHWRSCGSLCPIGHAQPAALSKASNIDLHLKTCHDACGTWSVHGLSPEPVSQLPSLSASIEYARSACDGAPATIELFTDGWYIVVHQERGWPRPLLTAGTRRAHSASVKPDANRTPIWRRFSSRLNGLWHPSARGSRSALADRRASVLANR